MRLRVVVVSAILLLAALPIRAQEPDVKENTALLGKSFAQLSGWILKAAEMGHVNLHYGNMVTDLRMLGLVPPSS